MIGVAILDQDPMIRSLLETHVKKVEGYEIIGSMESIEELKQYYRQGRCSCLLERLGDRRNISGLDCKTARRKSPLDFIVITKDTSYGTFYDMRRYGVIDYILKPFTYVRFRGALMQYRICKEQITPENEMTQKQLDLFFFPDALVGRYGGSHTLKNFNPHTYEKICEYARKRGGNGFTAHELAQDMNISRVTARRYLELMEKDGVLEVEMRYGEIGRPRNQYNSGGRSKVKKLVIASGNAGKVREFKEILKDWEITSMKEEGVFAEVDETGVTFEENAEIKARALADRLKTAASTLLRLQMTRGWRWTHLTEGLACIPQGIWEKKHLMRKKTVSS